MDLGELEFPLTKVWLEETAARGYLRGRERSTFGSEIPSPMRGARRAEEQPGRPARHMVVCGFVTLNSTNALAHAHGLKRCLVPMRLYRIVLCGPSFVGIAVRRLPSCADFLH